MMAALRRSLTAIFAALAVFAISGCGSDPEIEAIRGQSKLVASRISILRRGTVDSVAPNQQAALALRKALTDAGQPIYLVTVSGLGYTNLMAPYGQNGDVRTWASQTYETVSLRQGMLVATRGFGSDLMSSTGPSIDQISAGHGTTRRTLLYLDGADQRASFKYTCNIAPDGAETITILGQTYAARKVSEVCVGSTGRFTNSYWFDNRGNLRQSRQLMTPGREGMLLERIID